MKKQIISALIASGLIFFSAPAVPAVFGQQTAYAQQQSEQNKDYTYEILQDDTIELTKYSGDTKNAVIPSELDSRKVSALGKGLFSGLKELASIKIPSSIKAIGEDAFAGTKWLEEQKKSSGFVVVNGTLVDVSDTSALSITIPDNVSAIAAGALKGCKSLKNITIPKSVASIGEHAVGFVSDKYSKLNELTIYCYSSTSAETYAKQNGFSCAALDKLPSRIYGSDRYETAFKIADQLRIQNGSEKFKNVIVASGLNFADALSSAYLAKVKNAPILIVSDKTAGRVAQYIKENTDTDASVYIIGGTAAVSAAAESKLKIRKTVRIAGPNRYITNLLVLREADVKDQEILIASGTDYADALSASAVGEPIMLTAGKQLLESQVSYLKTISSKSAVIIGGNAAVDAGIEAMAKKQFKKVERIGGINRYETSSKVSDRFFASTPAAVLAYGMNYPDGLCGGPLAMKYGCPLLLTADHGFYYTKYAAARKGTQKAVTLGGGTLISDNTVRRILSTGISATHTADSVKLKWEAVAGAMKYDIYDISASRKKIGTVSATQYTYKAQSATTYSFEVVPAGSDGKALNSSAMTITVGTDPKAVSGLRSTSTPSNTVELSWNDTNRTVYQVLRKTTGSYSQMGTTISNRFTDSSISGGNAYEYAIRTVYTDGAGETHYSSLSASAKTNIIPVSVTFLENESGENYITVKWNKINGAASYSASIYKDGRWLTYTTANNYYTFSGLARAAEYNFSVRANMSGGSAQSKASSCTLATDSTLKSRTSFTIYASPSTSSKVLYTGAAKVVLAQKGKYSGSWRKVYIPGAGKSFGYVQASQVAGYVNLNFSPIAQLGWAGGKPLPTGCETTALATLLACHLKLPCTKNLLADKFLTTVGYVVGDPHYASWGSPYDSNAYGVMSPALAATANKFLKSIGVRDQYQIDVHLDNDKNMSWHKLDTGEINHTEGLDLDGIKKELEKGHAVQIWWITRGADPDSYVTFNIQRGGPYSHDGTGTYKFTWVGTQHGSVISGYDEATGEFIIADVGWGFTVRHSISHFMKIYTIQGRQSIVIYKK